MSDTTALMKDPVERTALLAEYLTGQCNAEQAREIEAMAAADEHVAGELSVLRALREEQLQVEAVITPGDFGWYRLRRDIAREKEPAKQSPWLPWNKIAAVAAMVLVVLQLTFWLEPFNLDEYRTYSSDGAQGTVLQLRFNPAASHAESQKLLHEIDAEIISGPSAAGLYRVSIEGDDPAIAQALKRLREAPDIISYAMQEE